MMIITILTAILDTYLKAYRRGIIPKKEALDKGYGVCDFALEIAGDEKLEEVIDGIWEEYQKAF